MRNSVVEPACILGKYLSEIPTFVTSFSSKEGSVVQRWLDWLTLLESELEKHNIPQSAQIAGYRSSIIAVAFDPEIERRTHRKKKQFHRAVVSVQPVQQILSDKHAELDIKITQVRELLRQVLIAAKDAGMVRYDPKTNFTDFLESLILKLKHHEQIGPEINSGIASIGKTDFLRLMAEEIDVSEPIKKKIEIPFKR